MQSVRALFVGTLAVGLLAYAGAAALGVIVQAGGGSLRLAAGPLVVVAVEHVGKTSSVTLGAGLFVIAVAGGTVNAVAALLLSRRSARG